MPDPCLASGVVLNVSFSTIYTTCANESIIAQEVFGFSLYPPPDFRKGQNASFLGGGDVAKCWEVIEKVFDFYDCPLEENCDEDNYQAPNVTGKVVVSTIAYLNLCMIVHMQDVDLDKPCTILFLSW